VNAFKVGDKVRVSPSEYSSFREPFLAQVVSRVLWPDGTIFFYRVQAFDDSPVIDVLGIGQLTSR
jgi:hypothetical protein